MVSPASGAASAVAPSLAKSGPASVPEVPYRTPAKAWVIVGLLFLYQVIATFEKLVLSLASPHLIAEFNLSPVQYGAIASSVYWLGAVSGAVFGMLLSNRLSSRVTLCLLAGCGALLQLPLLFVTSFAGLLTVRVLLGVSDGPGYPSLMHAAYKWFPARLRNLPTALISQGVACGFLCGGAVLTYFITAHGWRSAFLFCAGLSLLWLLLWAWLGEDGRAEQGAVAGPAARPDAVPVAALPHTVPYRVIWTDPTVIGLVITLLGGFWASSLSISWVAPYLNQGLGYSIEMTGWLTSLILGLAPPIVLTIAWCSQRLLLRGVSSRLARGLVAASAVLMGGVCMMVSTVVDEPAWKVTLLTLGFKLPHIAFVLGATIVGEIVPPAQRGPVIHLLFPGVTVMGFIAPVVFGMLVAAAPGDIAAGYARAVVVSGLVLAFAGLAGAFLINPERSRARLTAAVPT